MRAPDYILVLNKTHDKKNNITVALVVWFVIQDTRGIEQKEQSRNHGL